MSLISASQMVGLMAAFGGSETYSLYVYYQPTRRWPGRWLARQPLVSSEASASRCSVTDLRVLPTIEIRPGYQFNAMVTQDLVFPGQYGKWVSTLRTV